MLDRNLKNALIRIAAKHPQHRKELLALVSPHSRDRTAHLSRRAGKLGFFTTIPEDLQELLDGPDTPLTRARLVRLCKTQGAIFKKKFDRWYPSINRPYYYRPEVEPLDDLYQDNDHDRDEELSAKLIEGFMGIVEDAIDLWTAISKSVPYPPSTQGPAGRPLDTIADAKKIRNPEAFVLENPTINGFDHFLSISSNLSRENQTRVYYAGWLAAIYLAVAKYVETHKAMPDKDFLKEVMRKFSSGRASQGIYMPRGY